MLIFVGCFGFLFGVGGWCGVVVVGLCGVGGGLVIAFEVFI